MGKKKINPSQCCDPFKKKHKKTAKKIAKCKVCKISADTLREAEILTPELQLNSESLLCFNCRTVLSRQLRAARGENVQQDDVH
jgi:hypothetical protein